MDRYMDVLEKGSGELSKTGKKWVFRKIDERDVLYLKQTYNLTHLAATLAANRLDNPQEAEDFFLPMLKTHMPDPDVLPDAQEAFAFTHECLQQKKKMAVWGDYDVDGACAAALCVRYFQSLGHEIEAYVPDRFQEGYGPNEKGLQALKDSGVTTVFIVDCGTTAFEPLEWAEKNGLEAVIIDHHRVSSHMPSCKAFINPKRIDYKGPENLKTLCAAGLVFLFFVGLNRYLRGQGWFKTSDAEPDLFNLLDLVALSTICDMVPLKGLNRAFVRQGLKVMQQRKNVGLKILMDLSRLREAPTASNVGYIIGPRINAGGRIGDSSLGVKLLSSRDPYEAREFAQQLDQLNQERQRIERDVEEQAYQQALEQHSKPYLLLMGEQWHEGVLGIVASHLKEIFFKPTFVLTDKGDSTMRGSARSVPGLDIGQLIHHASDRGILLNGGGHPMAGGLSLDRSYYDTFCQFLSGFFEGYTPRTSAPTLVIDKAVSLQDLKDKTLFESLRLLEPFGVDYPQPRFLLSNVRFENITPFGYNHFRMKLVQLDGHSYPVVCFRAMGQEIGKWLLSSASQLVDCVVTVQLDRYYGLSKAQLILEDIR